ncbi:MAG: hypothetical protein FIA96_03725 [Betaproteobacteria bacterium]|nr:hypothetical protein [Betaproteobacteria bacterium]
MSESANTLPPEWKECAADTVRALAVARHLAARHATEETPESVLLPALLLSVTLTRTSAAICNRIEGVYGALECLPSTHMVENHLADIATALYELARIANIESAPKPTERHADGRK